MVDNFSGSKNINLQPNDSYIPLVMRITIASASTVNDGFIPFGSTLSSFTVTAHNGETNTSSTNIIVDKTVSGNNITVYLGHTTELQAGIYHVTATGVFSINGDAVRQITRQMDFNRVIMKDR